MKATIRIGEHEIPAVAGHGLSPTPVYIGGGELAGEMEEMDIYISATVYDRELIRELLKLFGEDAPSDATVDG